MALRIFSRVSPARPMLLVRFMSAGREKSVNRVELLGRAGSLPQLRGSADRPVVTFSLATGSWPVSSSQMAQTDAEADGAHEHTETQEREPGSALSVQWHRVCVFRQQLCDSVMRNLTKGHRVLVHGSVCYSQFPDNTGRTLNMTSIVAEDIIFLSTGRSLQTAHSTTTSGGDSSAPPSDD